MMSVKGQRLQIRVDHRAKYLLEEAARVAHLSVSAFVLQAAALRAEEVVAERQLIRLSGKAAASFEQALERPGAASERLAAALSRPRRFSWLD
jgi:uncharacterized protein (DUF1778 family)